MARVKIYNNDGILCDACNYSIQIIMADGELSPSLKHGDKMYKPDGSFVTIDCIHVDVE